jgi:hypothetical protein
MRTENHTPFWYTQPFQMHSLDFVLQLCFDFLVLKTLHNLIDLVLGYLRVLCQMQRLLSVEWDGEMTTNGWCTNLKARPNTCQKLTDNLFNVHSAALFICDFKQVKQIKREHKKLKLYKCTEFWQQQLQSLSFSRVTGRRWHILQSTRHRFCSVHLMLF